MNIVPYPPAAASTLITSRMHSAEVCIIYVHTNSQSPIQLSAITLSVPACLSPRRAPAYCSTGNLWWIGDMTDRFSSQVTENEPRIKFPPSSYSLTTYAGISTYTITTGYLLYIFFEKHNFRGIPGYIRHCWILFRQPLKMRMSLLPIYLRTYLSSRTMV